MDKLHFLICCNLATELQQVLGQYNFSDTEITVLVSNCGKPVIGTEELGKLINDLHTKDYADICIIGSVCLDKGFLESYPGIRLHVLDNCFELFLNKSILLKYISQGYYIISSGWLHNCWSNIKKWGFDHENLKQFFAESASKILYLHTSVFEYEECQIEELATHLGLDFEILEVRLDYFGNFIRSQVLQWRYDKERQFQNKNLAKLNHQAADYAVVFDQLNHLTALKSETEIVQSIMNLFNLLFSVGSIVYLPIVEGEAGEPILYPPDFQPPEDLPAWIRSETTEKDIVIKLSVTSEEIGLFRLHEVSFPQYVSHYKQLSEFLSSICSLGISNARKYSYLQKQEKLLGELIYQKDKLFSLLAHDLRRPVANFVSLAELMNTSMPSTVDQEYKELSWMMKGEAHYLFDLLQNLLEWSMFQSGRSSFSPQSVNFSKLAEEALMTTNLACLEKHQCMISNFTGDIMVWADRLMLTSILRNLLFNAIKFTPVNGTITLAAQYLNSDQVEISVSDTCVGIPEEIQDKLFKVGENVSRAGTEGEASTGLGLILVNEFVLAHGSQISIESRVGRGTKFSFILPAQARQRYC